MRLLRLFRRRRLCAVIVLLMAAASLDVGAVPGAVEDDPLNLALGDPARKTRVLQVAVDTLIDTATGAAIAPDDLPERLRDTKILLLGETHTAAEFHRIQGQVIAALQRAGRTITIGLEMFPYTQQAALDEWRTGALTETAFIDRSAWYEHWGYPWNYYRDIFLFARDHRLRMVALNAPRAVVSAVRKKGFKNLTPEEAAHIPADIDVDNAEHLALFKAYFSAGEDAAAHTAGMSDEAWRGMLSAQATWDATMGHHALQALRDGAAAGGGDGAGAPIVVVLVGAGHVAYDLGIKRQLARWTSDRVTTLIPVNVEADAHAVAVRASYANFVWGVPREAYPRYPSLGISTQTNAQTKALVVLAVDKDSPAGRAGLETGDRLVTFDGQPLAARADLERLTASRSWGDIVRLGVQRGGQELTLRLALQRDATAAPAAVPQP